MKCKYDKITFIVIQNVTYCSLIVSIVDEGKYYIYNYVFYPITDTGCIQFTVPIDMIEFAGVSIEDADVKAIMESVQLK